MQFKHCYYLSALVVAIAAWIACMPAAHAADPACKPVFDAMTRMAATPNHQFMTETAAFNAGPRNSEVITTAGATYVKIAGKWHASPYSPQQQANEMREASRTANETCQHMRDEVVAGEPAALYATRNKQDGGDTVDSQIWVSKRRELPVKQTIDIDVGGKLGKSHTDIRIDYINVQAPASAK